MKFSCYILLVFFIQCHNYVSAQIENVAVRIRQDTSVTACSYFEYMGTYYTASGDYSSSVKKANGSTYEKIIHLTILQPSFDIDVQRKPSRSFTWINGVTYTTSNQTAIYCFENGASTGCDSIVLLDLTLYDQLENSNVPNISIDVFPNPTSDVLNIKHNINGYAHIVMTDINGKVVYEKVLCKKVHQINLSLFSKGIYFLSFQNSQLTKTVKVVKQ